MFSNSSLLLVGHGSSVNSEASAPTRTHAETIRRMGVFKEVLCGFWKEEPGLKAGLESVETEEVYIVPNFISEGYFTQTVIPRELGLTGALTRQGGKVLKYCKPVGNHAKMTQLLVKRAGEVAPAIAPEQASLLIIGHGTGRNQNSSFAAQRETEQIRKLGRYGEVLSAYMDEPPLVADWEGLATFPTVIVVPFFIADGPHTREDIPGLLGIDPVGPSGPANPYTLRGKTLYYANAIGTEPCFAELLLEQAKLFDSEQAGRFRQETRGEESAQ